MTGLRHSLNSYCSGLRGPGLKLVRQIDVGVSLGHGLKKIAVTEKLGEAMPGEGIQSVWRPVRNLSKPVLTTMEYLLVASPAIR